MSEEAPLSPEESAQAGESTLAVIAAMLSDRLRGCGNHLHNRLANGERISAREMSIKLRHAAGLCDAIDAIYFEEDRGFPSLG